MYVNYHTSVGSKISLSYIYQLSQLGELEYYTVGVPEILGETSGAKRFH